MARPVTMELKVKQHNGLKTLLMVCVSFILPILLLVNGCNVKKSSENGDEPPPQTGNTDGWLYTEGNKI